MGTFVVDTRIAAMPHVVWAALSDIGAIEKWNPGVTRSYLTSAQEEGVGAHRHCDLGSKNYLKESVVAWENDRRLTMRITETNLPFITADIRFTLRPDGDGTLVTVSPLYTLKYGPVGRLLDRLYVRRTYRRGMQALLAGLKQFVESGRQRPL